MDRGGLYVGRPEEQPAIGLFYVTVDIGAVSGSRRQIDGNEGLAHAALAAETGDLHWIP